jgi:penicillin-binding protein 1A
MSRRDRQRRRRRNRGSPLKRVFALGGMLVLCAAIVGALAITGWVVNVAHSAPNLSSIHTTTPGSPSEVFAADGTPLGYIYSPNVHTPVAGNVLPHILKRATIDVEDRRFYQHGALDYQGILRAAIKDAVNGQTALQGASTLTMQLVDNRYLPAKYKSARARRDLKYKIVQAKLAEQLESKHSKHWILNSYLNNVPYGTLFNQTAYGAGAASEMFFSTPVQDLDLPQAALLAGLPQAPSSYNPFVDPKAAKERRLHVLQQMVRAGDISQARANAANRAPLGIKANREFQRRVDPYVFDYIEQQVSNDLCPGVTKPSHCPELAHGGLKIYTTIDLQKQAAATAAIRENATTLEEGGGPGTGAGVASVDAATGHIQAIATSGYYNQTKVNYATSASRQTGSAFKVFALMELIHDDHGDPNSTYYVSKPLPAGWNPSDPTWSVHTDDDVYHGAISIAEATAISDNTVFAQLAEDLGYTKLDAMAHAMGITSTLTGNPSEVLGGLTYGTTPLQMADAYATIADGGVHHTPTIIGKVIFKDGSSRDFGDVKGTRVFSYAETYAADEVLKKVITQAGATGTAANYGCPAAGKTGTAEDLANAWFVGYTPKISTAVWAGHPTGNVPMPDGFGGILAAPIWKDYMESTDGGYCGDWTAPSDPFEGTAFFGPNSASGSTSSIPGTDTTGTGTTTAPSTDTTSSTDTTQAAPTTGGTPSPPTGSPPAGSPPSAGGASTTGGGGLTGQ